jgi:PhzF family phenazine biosynthesis protein
MASGIPVFHVDAFTDVPFLGNGAAVCLLPPGVSPPDAWRQAFARDLSLSETAFVEREGDHFRLRWFTPVLEDELCGHATLASAHTLWEQGVLEPSRPAVFETRSGRLTCTKGPLGITMDFPDESVEPCQAPPGLFEALGIAPAPVYRNRLDHMVVVERESIVAGLQPDFTRLAKVATPRGFIVTAPSASGDSDYVQRFFCPNDGIGEDPATGSIQCALGPYWSKRLGKPEVRGRQLYPKRGATMVVRPQGKRVSITGQCVTVMRGELAAPALPAAAWLPGALVAPL